MCLFALTETVGRLEILLPDADFVSRDSERGSLCSFFKKLNRLDFSIFGEDSATSSTKVVSMIFGAVLVGLITTASESTRVVSPGDWPFSEDEIVSLTGVVGDGLAPTSLLVVVGI